MSNTAFTYNETMNILKNRLHKDIEFWADSKEEFQKLTVSEQEKMAEKLDITDFTEEKILKDFIESLSNDGRMFEDLGKTLNFNAISDFICQAENEIGISDTHNYYSENDICF